jgi:hypothetical protein
VVQPEDMRNELAINPAKRAVDLLFKMREDRAMPAGKHKFVASPAKPHRRVRLSDEDLKFISENQKLAGFSGRITNATATHEVDMDEIAESAKRFGAQIPSPQNRTPKPRITRFGSHPA